MGVELCVPRDKLSYKLPWAKVVVGCISKLNMGCCKICNEIDEREKLLVLKFDNLEKHTRR